MYIKAKERINHTINPTVSGNRLNYSEFVFSLIALNVLILTSHTVKAKRDDQFKLKLNLITFFVLTF